jgi:hypothetical protein
MRINVTFDVLYLFVMHLTTRDCTVSNAWMLVNEGKGEIATQFEILSRHFPVWIVGGPSKIGTVTSRKH